MTMFINLLLCTNNFFFLENLDRVVRMLYRLSYICAVGLVISQNVVMPMCVGDSCRATGSFSKSHPERNPDKNPKGATTPKNPTTQTRRGRFPTDHNAFFRSKQ